MHKELRLTPDNLQYIEDLYQEWEKDPQTVPQDWDHFFSHNLPQWDQKPQPQKTDQLAYKSLKRFMDKRKMGVKLFSVTV